MSGRLDAVWDFLFPPRCLGCGLRGHVLCSTCEPDLPRLPTGVCARCLSLRRSGNNCATCPRLAPALAGVRAPFAYTGAARSAVHALKFRSGRYLAPWMGQFLREAATRRPLQADLVVPAPLAARRLRDRGYNQAELLAREVAPALGGLIAADLLVREDRPAQQTLTAAERRRNLLDAVQCPYPDVVVGQRVVLIDDVMTTGATLSACARALAAAGATHVTALVFARDL